MIKSCPVCQSTHDDTMGACPAHTGVTSKDADDRLLGKVVRDRYHISARLGQGAMGIVYKAQQLTDGKQVALKVLHTHLSVDPEAIKRFQFEARAASSLMHPHIVRIFDFGMIPSGQPYIAMELLEGRTLSEVLKDRGHYQIKEALPLIRQACEALAEAHSHGVLHRDIKPANIMLLNRFGQEDGVVVLDFSISKVIQKVSDNETITSGVIMGSPAYMSPERFQGQGGDFRADIYSMGIIMFQMLAGRAPFKSSELYALMNDHVSKAPPKVKDVNPNADLPASMERIIARALMKKPGDRHSNMKQLLTEINDVYHELAAPTPLVPLPEDGLSIEPARPSTSMRSTQELSPGLGGGSASMTRSEPVIFEVNPGLSPSAPHPSLSSMSRRPSLEEAMQPLAGNPAASGRWSSNLVTKSVGQRPTIRPPGNSGRFPLELVALIVVMLIGSGAICYTLIPAGAQAGKIDALLRREDLQTALTVLSSWHPRDDNASEIDQYGESCLSLGKAFMRKHELTFAVAVLDMVPMSSKVFSEARTLAKQCHKQTADRE